MNYNYDIEELMKTKGSIGAWTKDANDAFANIIRETEFGNFDRIDWQFINFLNNNKTTTIAKINDFLVYFDNETQIQTRIDNFIKKKIINVSEDQVIFTEQGIKVFEKVYNSQKEILENAFNQISEEDYITTISVLKKMVDNLQPYQPK